MTVGSVLVTGATGFLGGRLIQLLSASDVQVRVLVRDPSRLDSTLTDLDIIEGDIMDPDAVEHALQGISSVYHCAAFVGIGGSARMAELLDINVQGTAHVLNAALSAGVRRVVHTSSIAALGRSLASQHGDCLDESAEWSESKLNTQYAVSKYLAELEVYRAVAEGLDAVVVNPSLMMGPGRPDENTMRIVESVRTGRIPAIPSGATNVVDVDDVARGMMAAMERGASGQRYLLTGQNLSWAAILTTLAEELGVAPPSRTVSPRTAYLLGAAAEALAFVTRREPLMSRESARISGHRTCYRNDKAVRELGLTFRPFRETARRIAQSYEV